MFKLIFSLMKIVLLLILYLVFIFYVELFSEGAYSVKFNIKILNKFRFIKKNIAQSFSINIYNIVNNLLNSLNILNIDFNINIDLFRRPGTNLRLFFFYIIYNFAASYLICCVTWAGSWRGFTGNFRHLIFIPEQYMYFNFKIAPFFMYLLITTEFLIILFILCFIWWQFECTILIPLNLIILLYYFYCFLFSFFCKFIIYLVYYLFNFFILSISNTLKYPFKRSCIKFFNNLWFWIKYAVWSKSSISVKIFICVYIFITFNFIFFFIYLFLFNIAIFY